MGQHFRNRIRAAREPMNQQASTKSGRNTYAVPLVKIARPAEIPTHTVFSQPGSSLERSRKATVATIQKETTSVFIGPEASSTASGIVAHTRAASACPRRFAPSNFAMSETPVMV